AIFYRASRVPACVKNNPRQDSGTMTAPRRIQTVAGPANKEIIMDKDRIRGAADQAKGSVKEGLGKATGDQKLRTEGAADKIKGKVESAVGGAKDTLRDHLNRTNK